MTAKVGLTGKCQELHFNQTVTAACVWHTLVILRVFTKQTTWKSDLLSMCSTYIDVHDETFYQSPGRKEKEYLFTRRNKCVHTGTHVSFLLQHSELAMHSYSVFPTGNFISRNYRINVGYEWAITRPPTALKEVLQIMKERSAISFSSHIVNSIPVTSFTIQY